MKDLAGSLVRRRRSLGMTMSELLVVLGVVSTLGGLAPQVLMASSDDTKSKLQIVTIREETPAERDARRVAWQIEPRGSMELRARVEIQKHQKDWNVGTLWDFWDEHYVEMAGKRYSDVVSWIDGKRHRHRANYGDGVKGATLTYKVRADGEPDRQQSLSVHRSFRGDVGDRMARPIPFVFLHVGRVPLQNALAKSLYLGTAKVLNRDCDIFLFERVRWMMTLDQVYYLDRDTGIPLKVEGFKDKAAREKRDLSWVWEANSLDRVGNFLVPLKSTSTAFEKSQPAFTWVCTIQSIEFGKDYPASTFWPSPTPGIPVLDTTGRRPLFGIIKKDQKS